MVDAVLSKISEFRQREVLPGATHVPIQSGSLHHVPGSTRLVVIFPYWHSRPSRFAAYRQRLHKKGISTLYYEIGPHMLQAHVEQVLYNFTLAADAMCDEIATIQAAFNLSELELVAFSLGTTYVGLLCARLRGLNTLRLIVPGDRLGACLWRSIATKRIRKGLEAQGVSEEDLLEAWQTLDTIAYAPILAHNIKQIFVTLARSDQFIPYDCGLRLVHELEQHDANLTVETWRTGHGAAVIRYLRTK